MNAVRKRKLLMLLFIAIILGLASALVFYALRQNINLFYSPTQIAEGQAAKKQRIRLGGMVVKGSLVRGDKLLIQFQLTDFKETITVSYDGTLPNLFREGQGIVALGELVDNQHFIAKEILAKHDANYMPPEVRNSLAKTVQSEERQSI